MPHLLVRLLEWNERANALNLGREWADDFGLSTLPDVRLVTRPHPHVAFRLGFPEFRKILSYAPFAVVLSDEKPPAWASLLKSLGCPVVGEEMLRQDLFGEQADWTQSSLNGDKLLKDLAAAEKITILDEGVAPREGDGLTIGTDILSAFADPAPDYHLHRVRSFNIPLPEDEALNIASPDEDSFVAGQPVLPLYVRHELPEIYERCIIRSSALWPTAGLPAPSSLVGATEIFRCANQAFSAPYAHLVIAMREAGITTPVVYRMHEDRLTGLTDPQAAMDLTFLTMNYGPFAIDKEMGGSSEGVQPLVIRVDLRDMNAGFVTSGVADWIAKCRGQSMDALERTWVSAPPQFRDFLGSLGYQESAPPSEVPQVTISLPPLLPLA